MGCRTRRRPSARPTASPSSRSCSMPALHTIEVGAFVSPRAIPQMVGSDEVLRGVNDLPGEFHVLVPNEKGYETARACGAKVISVFTAASEGFCRANINCSIAESIERFKPVVERAKADGIRVRGYVSTVLGCPFDGEVAPQGGRRCREDAVGSRLLRNLARRHHRRRHARQSQGDAARGRRAGADGQARHALPRHLRPGAGEPLCRNGGGRARDRFRGRRPRRLSVRARRHRQCRHRRRRLHARGHGDRNRRRHGKARRRHQRDHGVDRAGSREPGGECVECEAKRP